MPGAVELVRALHGRKRLAVATSSWSVTALPVLHKLGIVDLLDAVATGESVTRPKPHPDLLLHVADRLGVRPDECVALDDAEKGIRAALAAGMRAVAVPTPRTAHHDFSGAHGVVRSLAELSEASLDLLG